MNEHGYSGKTGKKLKSLGIHVWKINDNFAGGVPDFWFSARRDLWCEVKYLKALPKRAGTITKFGLSDLQKEWLRREHRKGRNVCVLIGCAEADQHWLFWGLDWDRDFPSRKMEELAIPYDEVLKQFEDFLHG